MCIEVEQQGHDTSTGSRAHAVAAAERRYPHQKATCEKHALLDRQPRGRRSRRMVESGRMPRPHHGEFKDRRRYGPEQRGMPTHRIEWTTGERQCDFQDIMRRVASQLSASQMRDVAAYFASLPSESEEASR